MIKRDDLFSTPVFSKQLTTDVSNIKDSILKESSSKTDVVNSNCGGWHSHIRYGEEIPLQSISLFNEIRQCVAEVYQYFSIDSPPVLQNHWYIVNRKHNFNHPHNHPGAIVSGVFYINAPDNCGDIVFQGNESLGLVIHSHATDTTNSYTNYRYTPKNNLLILFPANMQHYVLPNLSDDNRIALSFNYGVRYE